jgi:1-phosphofructokinase family hexose kinase
MILTVTLNPTLDKFYWVDRLPVSLERPKEEILIRSRRSMYSAGGKGVNVSIFLSCMEIETVAMGFLAGHTGQIVLRDLLARGAAANFVWIEGETRTNVTIIEKGKEYHPVKIHEEGPPVPQRAIDILLRKYRRMLRRARYVVIAGALPPNVPPEFYKELVVIAKESGVPAIVHAGGAALKASLAASPFFVKPDVREQAVVAGLPAYTEEDIVQAGRYVIDQGVEGCLISHDITGDFLVTRDGMWELRSRVSLSQLKSLVGADDALVAAMLARMVAGDSLLDAAKFGLAAGIAYAESEPKLCPSQQAVELELGNVEVVKKEGG